MISFPTDVININNSIKINIISKNTARNIKNIPLIISMSFGSVEILFSKFS